MDKPFFTRHSLLAAVLATGVLVSPGFAVQPQRWTHTNEADFEPGEVDGTIVTSLGDIKLATESKAVGEMPEGADVVYDIHILDGSTYLATGPKGKLLKQDGESWSVLADLPNEQVFALDEHNGKLLVGISGESSRLAVLDGGSLNNIAELEGVRYIWDVLVPEHDNFDAGSVIVATGTEGKVLLVAPGDEADTTELLAAQQANVLCLAIDKNGRVYAGTDEDGLIFKIEPAGDGYQAYALYDAPEPEIGTILVGSDGVIYAGTADAEQARPGRLEEAASEDTGKPSDDAAEEAADASDEDEVVEGAVEAEDAVDFAEPVASDPIDEPAASTSQAKDDESDKAADDQPTEEAAQAAAEPTPEQYDRLRELIRTRLQQARDGDAMPAAAPTASRQSRSRPVSAPAVEKQGNAVYRIDSQGFVSEVFRDSVMILKLVETDGKLLAATGNEGQVFVIDPVTHENAVLIDLAAEQIPALVMLDDGTTAMGTANPAKLHTLGNSFSHRGTYTSAPMDAAQISLFGMLSVTADIPEGCSVTIETRSGNVMDPEQAAWSPWSEAQSLMPDEHLPALEPKQVSVQSPPARFLQYRLTLTGTDDKSPMIDRVEAAYVTPNLKPVISTVTAAYPEESEPDAPPSTIMNIEWEAADDNQDPLVYALHYQPAGSDKALLIEDGLIEMAYEWETRRVPDGRYTVTVTADDRTDNPGDMAMTATRKTSPVLVDNTAPELSAQKEVNGRVLKISGEATDAFSPIRSIAYALDDQDEYHAILPTDLIFDSTRESWEVTISDLSPGPHVLTLRAADNRGNTVYHSVLLNVK